METSRSLDSSRWLTRKAASKVFNEYVSWPPVQSFYFKIQKFLEKPPISADPSKLKLAAMSSLGTATNST